ncbi:MAG: D-alanyl-D-alanine carboxypeptidase [Cyclobacteriaceae bacterium]|nr:D-alanyl-D-alanine carboxypeptidase [Cyclobacteriaceae bacterium]
MNYKILKIYVLILVTGITGSGCVGTRVRIEGKKLERYIENSEVLRQSFSGFLLTDPETGKIIHNYNGRRFFTPASNTKIFTLYASRKILGDSIPSIAYAMKEDTLYFTGLGDPTILHPDFPCQPALNFLAGSHLPLVYVPGIFLDGRLGPGWSWDDYPYAFSAEKSGFPVFGNVIHIKKSSMNHEMEVSPPILADRIEIRQDTLHVRKPGDITLGRDEYLNRFTVLYQYPVGSIDEEIPFIPDDLLIRDLLEDTLNKEVLLRDKFPDIWKNIIYSQPVDSLLRPMMVDSDNFFAEQLLLMSAYVLFDSLESEKTIDFAVSNFFTDFREEMYWVDGSGLSRYNQFTPYAISQVLRMLYLEYGQEYLEGIFPEGGIAGTMEKKFPELKGSAFGKTGSMSHVYNLSGYLVTGKGKWLIFSFMNNNFTKPSTEIRKEMTKILLAVKNRF